MTCERQSGKSETKRKIRAAGVAPRRAFMCAMPLAVTTLLGIHDALGQGRSLNIVNQCAQQVWAVFTPGAGTTQGAAQVNSGGWFQKYASQFNWTLTGFTGKSGQSSTLTVSSCPIGNGAGDCCPSGSVANPVTQCPNSSSFGVNQQIQVPLPDGTNFVTTITAVSTGGTGSSSYATLTIAPPIPNGQKVASVPISTPKAMAVSIPAGAPTLSLSVPNAGAPSQNLYFAMGNCPNGPFGGSGGTCIIGPPVGPLAGFNTLFEASFGCALDSTQSPPCAFNLSNPVCPAGAPYCGTANCSAQPTAANCGPLAPGDSYDVSAVAGYTIPMTVTVTPPAGAQCNSIDASLLDLASCPSETNKTIFSTDTVVQGVINGGVSLLAKDTSGNYQACLSPYQWFSNSVGTTANPHPTPNPKPVGSSCAFLPGGPYCTATSYYAGAGCTASMDVTSNALGCPVGGGPLGTGSPAGAQQQVGPGSPTSLQTPTGEYAIHNTYWVQQLYQMGYPGYTWSYGDATGGQGCPSIATSGQPLYPQYTVTLCPNGGTPYSKTQGWTYSSSSGLCVLSTSGGNYTSLAACQQANLKYACVNQADDSHVPNAMFQVSAKGMYSHQDIPTPTLTCKDLTLTFSGSSSSAQVPHCSFVFPGGSVANPCPQQRGSHDFNGTGISDILLQTTGNGVGMWLMNSSAAVASAPGVGTLPSGWTIVGQRDLNGDGFADLLLRYTDGSIAEWLMNGATIISPVGLGNPGTVWNVVGTGDFNGDSIGDVLLSGSGNAVAIWYMNSSGAVASAVGVGSLPAGWMVAGTGDFNGDGVWDILWYYQPSGAIALWLMNSNGTIKSPVGLGSLPPATWSIAGTGDFNGDGISDILWLAGGSSVVTWFMNSSGGIASAQNVANLPSGWTIAQTGDFNGDGKSDILLYFAGSGAVGAWLMNGATITGTPGIGTLPAPVGSWMLVTANSD